MTYAKVAALEGKWNVFEEHLKSHINLQEFHISEIQKLMTAESVVDITTHAIYTHTKYVQFLTLQLMQMRDNNVSESVLKLCELWTSLLENRKRIPLKIQHDKRLDGECAFDYSLNMMGGLPFGLDSVQILDATKEDELAEALLHIKYLGPLAHGFSFAGLPLMQDTVLSSLLRYKDTKCFLAKDKNQHIVGYSWGLMLRDIPVGDGEKANVFWVMDLAKHPDFYDPQVKVGTVLRETIQKTLTTIPDCHFVGYQHVLNHKFHLAIVDGGIPNKNETINLHDNQYSAKSMIKYNNDEYRNFHIIRADDNAFPYPKYKAIESEIYSTFGKAALSIGDFLLGGFLVFGRMYYQQWTHSLSLEPLEHKIEEPISKEQEMGDMTILKDIVFDKIWDQQGTIQLFSHSIPLHIKGLRLMDGFDFKTLQQSLEGYSWKLSRSKLTECFYTAVVESSNATTALNKLINNPITPKKWITLISEGRLGLVDNSSLCPTSRGLSAGSMDLIKNNVI